MDFNNIITLAISLLGTLGGCGLLYFRQEKRAKEITNESKTNDEWIRLYTEVKTECDKRDARIDELYKKIEEHRDIKATLRTELTNVKVELAELKAWRCDRTNCANRRPPSPITMTNDHTND